MRDTVAELSFWFTIIAHASFVWLPSFAVGF